MNLLNTSLVTTVLISLSWLHFPPDHNSTNRIGIQSGKIMQVQMQTPPKPPRPKPPSTPPPAPHPGPGPQPPR